MNSGTMAASDIGPVETETIITFILICGGIFGNEGMDGLISEYVTNKTLLNYIPTTLKWNDLLISLFLILIIEISIENLWMPI